MKPMQKGGNARNWRGFVAAPLLGTLIFLAAIVFVAHVNQVDRTETATIVSETYHNRIVNILEDYRADLGVIFAVNVVRAIQKHLTSECWTLFSLSNNRPDGTITASQVNPATSQIPPVPFNKYAQFLPKMDFDNLPFCHNTGSGVCTAGTASGDATNPNSQICGENCNRQLDYYELRYQKCAQVSEIIKDGICPYETDYGITAWINSTRQPYSFEGVNLALSNDNLVKSSFIDRIECEMTLTDTYTSTTSIYHMPLDGIKVIRDPANPTDPKCGSAIAYGYNSTHGFLEKPCVCNQASGCKIKALDGTFGDVDPTTSISCNDIGVGGGAQGTVITGENIDNCRNLIGDSLFDCRNFAVPENPEGNPFRCCDKFYYNQADPSDANNGRCCAGGLAGSAGCGGTADPKDHAIAGCGQGSFFVKVNILASDELYRRVPRVIAQDKVGNTIQGGALGQQNFLVHVKYPIYKYLDAAFKFYAPLSYGVSGSKGVRDYVTPTTTHQINIDFVDPAQNSKLHGGIGRKPPGYKPPSEAISGEGSHTGSSAYDNDDNSADDLSHGKGGTDQGTNEGVIEGVCYGPSCGCSLANQATLISNPSSDACTASIHDGNIIGNTIFADKPGSLPSGGVDYSQTVTESNTQYYNTFLDPGSTTSACRLVKNRTNGGICEDWGTCKMQIWVRGYSLSTDPKEFLLLCNGDRLPTQLQDPRIKSKFYSSSDFFSTTNYCNTNHALGFCSNLDRIYLTLDFRDFDDKTLVLPDPPAQTSVESPLPHNRFCWYATPQHYNPTTLP